MKSIAVKKVAVVTVFATATASPYFRCSSCHSMPRKSQLERLDWKKSQARECCHEKCIYICGCEFGNHNR
jgi:hypothetical protein